MTRPHCWTCRRNVRGTLVEHNATTTHRQAAQRAETRRTGTLRRGRPTWMTALRDYAHQYDDRDPGNSPEWDAAMAALA